jgi:hypothetical protein
MRSVLSTDETVGVLTDAIANPLKFVQPSGHPTILSKIAASKG